MKINKNIMISVISIIIWGILTFNLSLNRWIQIVSILISTGFFCFLFEVSLKEKHRYKNYTRSILYFYLPAIILLLIYILCFNMKFNLFAIMILYLLAISLIFILVKNNLYIPYLMLVSDISFPKARKLSHSIIEQSSHSSRNFVYLIIMIGSFLSFIQCFQMLPIMIPKINVLIVFPFFLLPSYCHICSNIKMNGNEASKGKASLMNILLAGSFFVMTMMGDPVFQFSTTIHFKKISSRQINGNTFSMKVLSKDYEDLFVRLRKREASPLEKKALEEISFDILPVDYEVYFVDSVSDKSKEGEYILGLTLLQYDKATSYISIKNENDIIALKHVLYHEYCHVILTNMEEESLNALQYQFEELDPNRYDFYRGDNELSKFYVSNYASEDAIEDMCEVYGLYRSYPELLESNEIYRKKRDLLLETIQIEYEEYL